MGKPAEERVVWTAAGTAALAEEKQHGPAPIAASDADVGKLVAALVKKYAAAWKKGLAKADAVGKAAVAFATKYKPGVKATPEQLAGLVTLAASNGDDPEGPVIELVVREYGWDVTMRVLIATWSLAGHYDGRTHASLKSWAVAVPADHQHVFDTSACCGKREMTRYLERRYFAGSDAERKAMRAAVDAVWAKAPRHAKPALAVIVADAAKAAEIARDLLANDKPHAFFAWQTLPHVLTDAELVAAALDKRDERLSYRIVENLGVDALPLFEARMSEHIDKYERTRVLATLSNIRSPRVAKILAEYAEVKPYVEIVRTYFGLHRDLLDQMLADPELRYYHDDLLVLKDAS
jgi:hypothetical protein